MKFAAKALTAFLFVACLVGERPAAASSAAYQPTASIAALQAYGQASGTSVLHAAVYGALGGDFDWISGNQSANCPAAPYWYAATDVAATTGCWHRTFPITFDANNNASLGLGGVLVTGTVGSGAFRPDAQFEAATSASGGKSIINVANTTFPPVGGLGTESAYVWSQYYADASKVEAGSISVVPVIVTSPNQYNDMRFQTNYNDGTTPAQNDVFLDAYGNHGVQWFDYDASGSRDPLAKSQMGIHGQLLVDRCSPTTSCQDFTRDLNLEGNTDFIIRQRRASSASAAVTEFVTGSTQEGLVGENAGSADSWTIYSTALSIDVSTVNLATGAFDQFGNVNVDGDTHLLSVFNTANVRVLSIGTVKAWTGSGSDVTDAFIAAIGALNMAGGASNTPEVSMTGTQTTLNDTDIMLPNIAAASAGSHARCVNGGVETVSATNVCPP